jgi:hypothetical protein
MVTPADRARGFLGPAVDAPAWSSTGTLADSGVELTLETLVPEVTITADAVYWHPVGADHDDQLVTRSLFPLADAIDEVRRRFVEMRATTTASALFFPCA